VDKATAWNVIQAAFRCGRELQALLPSLKDRCGPDEYKQYARGVGAALDSINTQLIEPALNAHPELREKIEPDLAKFGHIT